MLTERPVTAWYRERGTENQEDMFGPGLANVIVFYCTIPVRSYRNTR